MKVKKYSVKPAALAIAGCIALLSLRALAQEIRSEVQRSRSRILHQGQQRQWHSEQPTFDLGFKTWVRAYLVGRELVMRIRRGRPDSGETAVFPLNRLLLAVGLQLDQRKRWLQHSAGYH